jgi:hypothetical protein
MIGRRQAIQALGIGVLAAPAAARDIASNAISGVNMGYGLVGGTQAGNILGEGMPMWQRARTALADKDTLAAVRSVLFEQNKVVTHLDADLATKRSFSLAAKIAYQRERNVQAEIDRMSLDHMMAHPWSIMETFLGKRSG